MLSGELSTGENWGLYVSAGKADCGNFGGPMELDLAEEILEAVPAKHMKPQEQTHGIL